MKPIQRIESLKIKEASLIQSKKSNRYGIKLLLSINNDPKTMFYHTIWLGNYKDFQKDSLEKSTILWLFAKDFLNNINADETYLDDKEKLIGIEFTGLIDINYPKIELNKIILFKE